MKKTIIIIALFLLTILLGFLIYNKVFANEISESVLNKISISDFIKKTENKETFAIYIGYDGCHACQTYKPTLLSVVNEYNIKLYYLDYSKITLEDKASLISIISIQGTPTIAFIKNGEEESTLNRIYGVTSKEDTIARFKLNGYIKNSK